MVVLRTEAGIALTNCAKCGTEFQVEYMPLMTGSSEILIRKSSCMNPACSRRFERQFVHVPIAKQGAIDVKVMPSEGEN